MGWKAQAENNEITVTIEEGALWRGETICYWHPYHLGIRVTGNESTVLPRWYGCTRFEKTCPHDPKITKQFEKNSKK